MRCGARSCRVCLHNFVRAMRAPRPAARPAAARGWRVCGDVCMRWPLRRFVCSCYARACCLRAATFASATMPQQPLGTQATSSQKLTNKIKNKISSREIRTFRRFFFETRDVTAEELHLRPTPFRWCWMNGRFGRHRARARAHTHTLAPAPATPCIDTACEMHSQWP